MQILFLVNHSTKIKTKHIYFCSICLGQSDNNKTELKVTQRLRLDQHKLDELEKKLRTSVSSALSNSNVNGQSSGTRKQANAANQTKFALLITSPKAISLSQRKSNGKTNSPNHPLSSDENDERSQSKKDQNDDEDDESSLSRFISYLAV